MAPQCCKLLNLKGYRIQNITQTLELFEAAEENYWDDVAVESFSFVPQYRNSSQGFRQECLRGGFQKNFKVLNYGA